MKIKITCPKCGSNNVSIVPNPEGASPLYECGKCGHKSNLFPQFGKNENTEEEKIEEEKEDLEEEFEDDEDEEMEE